ncbi:MAG: glycoside hydrolase family 36 protein [Lachnospiraceae bacterium]|jgi:alpha-galactosidase
MSTAEQTGKWINIEENGIFMTLSDRGEKGLQFFHFGARPFRPENLDRVDTSRGFLLAEVSLSGYDVRHDPMGNKEIGRYPGTDLAYDGMDDLRNDKGRRLVFHQHNARTGLVLDTFIQFYDGIRAARFWNTVKNGGSETQTLDYITSFHYEGLGKDNRGDHPEDYLKVGLPHSGWQREVNWRFETLAELGMDPVQKQRVRHSSNFVHVENTGNWSAKEYLPMGWVYDDQTNFGLLWQIEQNGSWHWEIGDRLGFPYVSAGGPNELYNHWFRDLAPGDSFTTVPVAVAVTGKDFTDAVDTMTLYRRAIRRPNRDDENLPIIFNDYMNCLFGDPTTAKELPLIDAAAKAGCEYYVIDCGWYADGNWWDNVGEWQESRKRFPNGVKEVTDYIRSKGMIPGLWLELEVMGVHCRKASEVPDDWFFMRHGRRVYYNGRYQLDYRNPEVRAYATSVIDRLVQEYGVGYIKMDYNIEPGIGTELDACSVGDGLLGHERAYLEWLDGIFAKYPDLVIENCSSGGMRMDYAMLSRYSIQSTSDNENYLNYATIAANVPTACTPEQAAVWSYPLREGDDEEVIFNMVSAMLLRIHQSGHLAELSERRFSLVREGLEVYRQIRGMIRTGVPFWPQGLSLYDDEWVCLGIASGRKRLLAVWRRSGMNHTLRMKIPELAGKDPTVSCLYPKESNIPFSWDRANGILKVTMEKDNMARLFELVET